LGDTLYENSLQPQDKMEVALARGKHVMSDGSVARKFSLDVSRQIREDFVAMGTLYNMLGILHVYGYAVPGGLLCVLLRDGSKYSGFAPYVQDEHMCNVPFHCSLLKLSSMVKSSFVRNLVVKTSRDSSSVYQMLYRRVGSTETLTYSHVSDVVCSVPGIHSGNERWEEGGVGKPWHLSSVKFARVVGLDDFNSDPLLFPTSTLFTKGALPCMDDPFDLQSYGIVCSDLDNFVFQCHGSTSDGFFVAPFCNWSDGVVGPPVRGGWFQVEGDYLAHELIVAHPRVFEKLVLFDITFSHYVTLHGLNRIFVHHLEAISVALDYLHMLRENKSLPMFSSIPPLDKWSGENYFTLSGSI
jgi:hypothetical protein